ncbi:MAG TPA: CpaF family protein, partial [Telluria sp.]|nr:CpaF family protein [Telluria sp.]
MSLREKLSAVAAQPALAEGAIPADGYQLLKARIHLALLEQFDLTALENAAPEVRRAEIGAAIERVLETEPTPVNDIER